MISLVMHHGQVSIMPQIAGPALLCTESQVFVDVGHAGEVLVCKQEASHRCLSAIYIHERFQKHPLKTVTFIAFHFQNLLFVRGPVAPISFYELKA
jgi:hypothetical protein